MSKYTALLDNTWYQPHPMVGRYVTKAEISWEVGRKGSGLWVNVPVGFVFDVSIPFVLSWLLKRDDIQFFKAACLHDHLLADGWEGESAGAVFSDALKADGVDRYMRLAMWLAVSLWRWK